MNITDEIESIKADIRRFELRALAGNVHSVREVDDFAQRTHLRITLIERHRATEEMLAFARDVMGDLDDLA